MASIIDDIVSARIFDDVVGALVQSIDEWKALPETDRGDLATHLGLTAEEYASWGGPGERVVRGRTWTTLGDARALQDIIQRRVEG